MTKQKNILNNPLMLLTTFTNSLTPSTISPIFPSLSSPSLSSSSSNTFTFTTKLPKEPPPNKQTKKHHRKLSFLYKQIEHLELKLLFKRAFIERELSCKLELANKIKDEASELELIGLSRLNQIRSKIILLQNSDKKVDNLEKNKSRQQRRQQRFNNHNNNKNKNNNNNRNNDNNIINNNNYSSKKSNNFKPNLSCSSINNSKNSLNKNDNSLSNQDIVSKDDFSDLSLDGLSIEELTDLLEQKEKEMNTIIQSSQNQIEELLKDAYDYLEEEEYLKLDIQDIKLEIEDLETMCI